MFGACAVVAAGVAAVGSGAQPRGVHPQTDRSHGAARFVTAISVPVRPPTGANDSPSEHAESAFLAKTAIPKLTASAMSLQSGFVHAVSGATYTSEGFATSLQGAIARLPGWLALGTSRGPLSAVTCEGCTSRFGKIQVVVAGRAPVTSIGVDPDGGYWLAAANGGVRSSGTASLSDPTTHASVVTDLVATSSGKGYYMLLASGEVLTTGDAKSQGENDTRDLSGLTYSGWPSQYAVAIVPFTYPGISTPYYFVLTNYGQVYGDSPDIDNFHTPYPRNSFRPGPYEPAIGAVLTSSERGAWIFLRDGKVYRFGNAPDYGSPSAARDDPGDFVAAVGTTSGKGYYMVTSAGQVFTYGNATSYGSIPQLVSEHRLTSDPDDIVAAGLTPSGGGYYLVGANGVVYPFGDASS